MRDIAYCEYAMRKHTMAGVVDPRKLERFALGIASGLTVRAAALRAGYCSTSNHIHKIARRPEFQSRVAELKLELQWGRSGELGPVVNALRALAERAAATNNPLALSTAQKCLTEAARLKAFIFPEPDGYDRRQARGDRGQD